MKRNIPKATGTCVQHAREDGFTRWELVVVFATLVLVAGVVVPAIAHGRPRSLQAICANNLRTIGQAVGVFNAENGSLDPWRMSQSPTGLGNNAWFQFVSFSNELRSPRVLACPSDGAANPAKNYSFSRDGGFLNASYQNNAVSYFIGLDSTVLRPDSVLASDRNLRYSGLTGGCSSGINPALAIYSGSGTPTGWRDGLHGPAGNLLLHDGRVEQTSNESVNRWFGSVDDNGSIHFLAPRL